MNFISQKLPSKYAIVKNSKDDDSGHTRYQPEHLKEEKWVDSGSGLTSSGRGRGGRGRGRGRIRGGTSQRRVISKRTASTKSDGLGQALGWRGRPRGRGGRRRGRRSIRSRQRPAKVDVVGRDTENPKDIILEKSPSGLVREEWNGDESMQLQGEDAGTTSSLERSDYDYENGLATGDEYDDDMVMDDYAAGYHGRSDDLLQGTYYNVDVDVDVDVEEEEEEEEEDDDDDDDVDDNEDGDAEEEQGDLDIEEYINGDSDEEENSGGDREQNLDQDQGTYTSSDYSE